MQPGPFQGTSAPPGGVSLDHLRARLGSLVVLRVSRGGLGVEFGTKIDDFLMLFNQRKEIIIFYVWWSREHKEIINFSPW